MKKQQSPKAGEVRVKNFPQCMNRKEARMVCLNEGCEQYAFFCLQCDDESCELAHRHQNHEDKYVAISFKEFVRRVLRERKPTEEFSSAVNTYRDTLQRLRTDINEFVERELSNLTQMMERASDVSEELLPLVQKLREEKYTGLLGKEMDYLWRNCADTTESMKMQAEMADFIRIKDQELKAISEHFENLNKMEVDKDEPTAKKDPGKNGKQTPAVGENSKGGKQEPSKTKK